MCGIVGILGQTPVAPLLVDALERLEYRGYDSAGIATLENGHLTRRRAEGKLKNLKSKLTEGSALIGTSGIGHVRWATHGAPTELNAHPHSTSRVAVVHNGIIENFRELKVELGVNGAVFESDTDTEVIVQLIDHHLRQGIEPLEAVNRSLKRCKGAFAIAAIFAGDDNLMVVARRGMPLAIGYGIGQMFAGSDAIALAPFTDQISYLKDGDRAVLTRTSVHIYDEHNQDVTAKRPIVRVTAEMTIDKGGYEHFMIKEIKEQPEVVNYTLAHYWDFSTNTLKLQQEVVDLLHSVERMSMGGCGTAYYAGMVGEYLIEEYARLPVDVDIASEFRYRKPPLSKKGMFLVVSQSGETADTLAALHYAQQHGQQAAAIVNVPSSAMANDADYVMPTLAGPEVGVASTKAFTCQLAVLASLAVVAGKARGEINPRKEHQLLHALSQAPRLINQTLKLEDQIAEIAYSLKDAKDALYLGRGTSYPIALEGALKLKEISYIHAEGYGAGELKHGPLALIDEHMPVIVIAPSHQPYFDKTISNMQEVLARKGRVILLTDSRGAKSAPAGVAVVVAPNTHPLNAPFVYAVLVQLLAYHTAKLLGTDIDKPRNLAKSVTVE